MEIRSSKYGRADKLKPVRICNIKMYNFEKIKDLNLKMLSCSV